MERHALLGIVIDASILVKWFVAEDDTENALRLRNDYLGKNVHFIAPDLAIYETANALFNNKKFANEEVHLAVHDLHQCGIEFLAPDAELIADTVKIAKTCKLTIYDAVYAALAQRTGYTLVTSDLKLLNACPHAKPLETFKKPSP